MAPRFDQPLPPSFDSAFYRARNPDLDLADDAAAAAHYAERGRAEGRVASPLAEREGLVAAIDRDRAVLEIGPFCAPLVKGAGVEYLDRLDAPALRARAKALGMDASNCPARVHHVGELDRVAADSFDAVVASHSIEHQPDLVRHLEEVARVLCMHGRYFLVVPDKRFCFDHFLPESTLADVLDAFEEERTRHRLASVVEHVALVTHNDPVRHWRGDHGAVDEAERRRRTTEALAAYRRSDGAYLDVHAWQFTPESFAALLDGLARLDLSALELEAVYDTPRDRAEFCAVLRRARPARRAARRRHGLNVTVLQSAETSRDASLLATTTPNLAEFCRRQGLAYRSRVGIAAEAAERSGFGVELLQELIAQESTGWALCLAADAYVADFDFDLPAYLHAQRERAAILPAPDASGGVALLNLGHPLGRQLAQRWVAACKAPSEASRREPHALLRDDPLMASAVLVEPDEVLGSAHARFVRRPGEPASDDFDATLAMLRDEVSAIARAWRLQGVDRPPADPGSREAARLLHPIGSDPWLAEAMEGSSGEAAAERALASWRTASGAVALHQQPFADALEREDRAAVAGTIRALGRSPVARGLLGGDQQHRRCTEDPAFAHARALRTQDELLSLAELTGAVRVESPDLGAWGRTRGIAAPALFAGIEETLGHDLSPPATIGSHLGVEVGRGLVLHLRMVEAIHAAWRVTQVADMLGLSAVAEIGGGIGLTAWYARRFGMERYRLIGPAVGRSLQVGVLAELTPAVPASERIDAPLDLLVVEDLAAWPEGDVAAHLADAVAQGARAVLSFGHEAGADPARPRSTVAGLLAASGRWRLVGRARHGLRPGYLEEIFRLDG